MNKVLDWIRLLLFIILIPVTYIVAGTLIFGADNYRLDEQCETTGFWGEIEESLLGDRYWRVQISLIENDIILLESLPDIARKRKETKRKRDQWFDEQLEKRYTRRTDTRPSAKQQQVDALRKRADEIEEDESWAVFDAQRLLALQVLRACRVTVSEKLD